MCVNTHKAYTLKKVGSHTFENTVTPQSDATFFFVTNEAKYGYFFRGHLTLSHGALVYQDTEVDKYRLCTKCCSLFMLIESFLLMDFASLYFYLAEIGNIGRLLQLNTTCNLGSFSASVKTCVSL